MKKTAMTAFIIIFMTSVCGALTIVIPGGAGSQEKTAADELAEHVSMATGAKPKIEEERKERDSAEKYIYLGATEFAKKKGYDFSKFGGEEWLIKAEGENTLIIGGGRPRGVIYGAYEFLERNLGVIWLDEWSTHVPKTEDATWDGDLNLRGKPSFAARSIYSNFINGGNLFKMRSRQNFFHVSLGAEGLAHGIHSMVGSPDFCHTFYYYTKNLSETDEDVLSLAAGKRVVSTSSVGPGQICYSNPKTGKFFTEKLLSWIALDRKEIEKWQFPLYYALMTNDNRNECECAVCREKAKKSGWSGLKLDFVNTVARSIAQKYPDITIMTDAYGLNAFPSRDVKPEKNVSVQVALGHGDVTRYRDPFRPYSAPLNKTPRDILKRWGELCNIGIWDYWIDFIRPFYPSTNLPAIVENLRFYKDIGASYVFAECEHAECVSLWPLRIWIGHRMMNNIDLDLRAEINRFMNAYYGKAAPMMLKYHDTLQSAGATLKDSVCDLTLAERTDLDKNFFDHAGELFSAAEKAETGNPVILERIANERVPVDRARIEKFHVSDKNIIERYRENATRRLHKYLDSYHAKPALAKLETFCKTALAAPPPLKGFEKQAVIADYTWPTLANSYFNKLVEDPEAAGGYAVVPRDADKKNQGISLGVYDNKTRKYAASNAQIPQDALPTDEKFHLYPVGRCRLTANAILFMHWTWTAQQSLQEAFTTPEVYDNNAHIYVSLKVQGPLYVKGSTRPNMYAIDRVVITRGDIGAQHPTGHPLPSGIQNRIVTADLAGTSLRDLSKIADPDSVTGCAVKIGPAVKEKLIYTCFLDRTEKLPKQSQWLTLPRDGQYHLYSIGGGPLTNNCFSCVGEAKIILSDYYTIANPDKNYEFFTSVKANEDGQCYMDRFFLAEMTKK